MARKTLDRRALLSILADHVLEHGLNSASLRPMAAAANTSDRMLIYYFGSKEGLVAELLEFLASRMAVRLDTAIPPDRYESENRLIQDIVGLMRSEAFAPYVRVWLDIVAAAAQGHQSHRNAGHAIIKVFLEWLAKRHPRGAQGASHALTLIEGTLVMDAVGHHAVTDSACETD